MNWEAVGAIGEILGAVGVIATLVYLARQINQNTTTVRASSAAAVSEANTSLSTLLAQDAEVNRLFWSSLSDRDSLPEEEQRRADAIIATYIGVMEQAHDLFLEGAISEEKWTSRQAQLKWLVTKPGFGPFWEAYGPTYAKTFAEVVTEAQLDDPSPPAA